MVTSVRDFYSTNDVLGGMTPGPAGMSPATSLWSSTSALSRYDAAIFSCECSEAPDTKDNSSYAAVRSYLDMGGRSTMASIPGGAPQGNLPIVVNTTFPKGKALADWMDYAKLSTAYGQVYPDAVRNNFLSSCIQDESMPPMPPPIQ